MPRKSPSFFRPDPLKKNKQQNKTKQKKKNSFLKIISSKRSLFLLCSTFRADRPRFTKSPRFLTLSSFDPPPFSAWSRQIQCRDFPADATLQYWKTRNAMKPQPGILKSKQASKPHFQRVKSRSEGIRCLALASSENIHFFIYRNFPKYSDTQNICCNHSKIWTMWLYHRVMSPNDADGMANSVNLDHTAPLRAVWSGSALFAQAYMSENLGSLRYTSSGSIPFFIPTSSESPIFLKPLWHINISVSFMSTHTGYLFHSIIPQMNFPCKTSIGRREKFLLSPCDNFDYHMRSTDARTAWICQTFYYNGGTETHISSH